MTQTQKTPRERLIAQKEKLDAKIKQLDARERLQKRKRDTRKKIILGGLVLTHMEIDKNFHAIMTPIIEKLVTRENDRPLFDLLPLEKNKHSAEKKTTPD